MAKGKRRQEAQQKAREAKAANASGKSRYARKSAYLKKAGLWGFEIQSKPWK